MRNQGNRRADLFEARAARGRGAETTTPAVARSKPADEELEHFFDLSLDLMCIAGLDGYFKRLNPAWTTHLGWTLEELTARPFLDFVHPEDREATLAEVEKLGEGIPTVCFENRYRGRDGSYRWPEWNARTVPGPERIYAAARDITRELEDTHKFEPPRFFRRLFRVSQAAIA